MCLNVGEGTCDEMSHVEVGAGSDEVAHNEAAPGVVLVQQKHDVGSVAPTSHADGQVHTVSSVYRQRGRG